MQGKVSEIFMKRFFMPILLILFSNVPSVFAWTSKRPEPIKKVEFYMGESSIPQRAFIPLASIRHNKRKRMYGVKVAFKNKVKELGGDAVLKFECNQVGISGAAFVLGGMTEPVVKGCSGVAVRWAEGGERGQGSITGKEALPIYDLQ